MTEVAPADRLSLLRLKRAECSSIVTSRKRKLRELFAVATELAAIPNHDFQHVDAPLPTHDESHFLIESNVLQTPDGFKPPSRPQSHLDALQRFLAISTTSLGQTVDASSAKQGAENGFHSTTENGPAGAVSKGLPKGHRAVRQDPESIALASKPSISPRKSPGILAGAAGVVAKGEDGHLDAWRVATPPRMATVATDQDSGATSSIGVPATEVPANRFMRNGEGISASTNELPQADPPVSGEGVGTGHNIPTIVPTPMGDDAQDAMDIDVPDQVLKRRADLPAIQLPAGDVSKGADLLSSPGSTAHSATTPAIHDASTDTSPDNEVQYGDREEERVEHEKDGDNIPSETGAEAADTTAPASIRLPEDSQGPANQAIEAQLLEESAAARDSQSDERSPQPLARATGLVGEDGKPDGEVASALPVSSEETSDHSTMAIPLKIEIRDSQESSPVEAMDIDQQPSEHPPKVRKPEKEVFQGSSEPPSAAPGKVKQQKSLALEDGPHQTDVVKPLPTPGEQRSDRLLQHVPVTLDKNRGVSKKRVPTVVFGKQRKRKSDKLAITTSRSQPSSLLSEDYFTPLFVQNFAQQTKWMKQIDQLIHHAHKGISTTDLQTAILENQACKVLKRVYHLQQHDKWSLRQPKRCTEPTRPPSHWDVLLQEIKWMRTDFREERKWKTTVARNLALACAEWVASTPEQKKALQVNVSGIQHLSSHGESSTMVNGSTTGEEGDDVAPTPELIASGDASSPAADDDDLRDNFQDTVAPSAIFAMPDDDVIFSLRKSPTSDQLLEELPMYGAPLKVPKFDLTGPEYDPDFLWRRPAVPLSKYIEGQVVLSSPGPPSVRGRYQFMEEDGEDDDEQVLFGKQPGDSTPLTRENKEVALFNPEMRPIRDRLHAGHQFRPPTEHPMPLQSFFESRPNSQWTTAEDDKLKALVREHSYNWSLISGLLSTKSLFSSGAERRTPWECFERWIALEGLPNDMSKTQYFKTYQNRIDAATRAIQEQQQKAQQQAGANGSLTPVQRRRPTHPIKVERRRNQKHLALIDAMRKLAKKRETAIQKQQYAASLAASRKANEQQQQQRGPTKTPREYSLMRYERDQQLAEKMAQYAQRQSEVQRRQQVMARSQGQTPQAVAGSNPVPPQVAAQLSANPLAGTPRANIPSQLAVPGQARPRMPMQAPPNGMAAVQAHMGGGLVAPIPMNGIPQAQMQAMQAQAQQRMQQQMPNPQPDIALVLQARRIQDQQRAAVQLQQQQAHQQQGPQQQQLPQVHPGAQVSPTGMRTAVNGMNQQNFLANSQAMMAASFNAAGGTGMGTPPAVVLNMAAVAAGSPRTNAAQQLPPAMMNHIRELETSFKAKNPNLTEAQARALAYSNYHNIMVRQNAIASASGSSPQQGLVNGIASNSPHQYAQLLRAQQQAQAVQAQSAQQHQRQSSSGAVSK